MIIGILGNKNHGKDTISDYISNKYDFKKEAFAGPLKDICKILFGFNNNQLYGDSKDKVDKHWGFTPRDILQFVGTELFRNKMDEMIPGIGTNFWLKCMRRKCLQQNIVISDVRFQNEVDFIHELNGIIIKVQRDEIKTNDNHISEQEVEHISNYDFLIKNNSDKSILYSKVDEVIKQLGIQSKERVCKSNFDTYVLGC